MNAARSGAVWLVVAILLAAADPAAAQDNPRARAASASCVPLAELPPGVREQVRRVLEQPALFARGPTEEFAGCSDLYFWFLDHPHRAAAAWRRLGAPCLEITDRGNGRFAWNDGEGTEICWETIYRSPALRVWYAEGCAKPAPLLPSLPVRAVVVLRHQAVPEPDGRALLYQQADLFVQTDSRTVSVITRLLGPSVPRMAEQGVAQLEMFFSVLVGYLNKYPERAERLLGQGPAAADGTELAVARPE
jgi:hypothetical protein